MKKLLFSLTLIISLIMSSYSVFTNSFNTDEQDTLSTKRVALEKKELPLTSPLFIKESEKKLLAQLVDAEAKGEPFEGKVAVADVVLNRVESEEFPDTLKDVIYQENAFEPVENGSIHEPASKEAVQAVETALEDQEENKELLYFYNPETATSKWVETLKVVKKIGNHSFAI